MKRIRWIVAASMTIKLLSFIIPAGGAPPAEDQMRSQISRGFPGFEGRELLRTGRARWETARRMEMEQSEHPYDVLHYEINLEIDILNDSVRTATTIIDCRSVTDTLTTLPLQLVGMVVAGVTVDQAPAEHRREDGWLYIELGGAVEQGDSLRVAVNYHGQPIHTGGEIWESGLFIGSSVTYTNCVPYGSRNWFPCYDHPSDKATAEVNITVPQDYIVASNGKLVETVAGEQPGTLSYRWSEGHPIATYLISLAISRYAVHRQWYCVEEDSMQIDCYVYPADSADAVVDFANLPEMIACYSQLFGPYPFLDEKYGMAVAPIGGAMENQTCVTWGLGVTGDQYWDMVVAHELAHQWWGDWVSPIDWREVWLNEGFATYAEALWWEHLYGDPGLRSYMEAMQSAYLQWEASSGIRFPIYDPPPGYLFSPTEYEKAGSVLHMLRFVAGDSAFFDILKTYGAAHGYGNAGTDDFQNICEDLLGQDLDWFFDQWIYDRGHPEYSFVWTVTPTMIESFLLDIYVTQEQENAPIFDMPVEISITTDWGEIRDTVIVDEASELFQMAIDCINAPQDVQLDPDGWLLCTKEGLHVTEPILVVVDWAIDDSQGDSNGWLSPGETAELILTLQNQGASIFGLTATLETCDPDVHIIQGLANYGFIRLYEGADNQATPFVLSCASEIRPHRSFFSLIVGGAGSFEDTLSLRLPVGDPNVLLVDDDGEEEQELFYIDHLDSLGVVYELHQISGASSDIPCLRDFEQVIWFTAGQDSATLAVADQESLAAYLDGGGALLISGSGLGNDIGETAFYAQYFHTAWGGEISIPVLQGITSDPISQGDLLVIYEQGGRQDVLWPQEDASTTVCFNYMDNGVAAIKHRGQHKMVYFGFGLETVRSDNPSSLSSYDLMARILSWFGVTTHVQPEEISAPRLPGSFRLAQNYPNPFNASTHIFFQIPQSMRVELMVFNVSGQQVRTLLDAPVSSGGHTFLWDGTDDRGRSVASGIYFCQIRAGDVRRTVKMLLLR